MHGLLNSGDIEVEVDRARKRAATSGLCIYNFVFETAFTSLTPKEYIFLS